MTIKGHRTSISLEEAFWQALKQIADMRDLSISAVVSEIDDQRTKAMIGGAEIGGLSSMIRLYILDLAISGRLKKTDLGR